jgi:hypothetical protein
MTNVIDIHYIHNSDSDIKKKGVAGNFYFIFCMLRYSLTEW